MTDTKSNILNKTPSDNNNNNDPYGCFGITTLEQCAKFGNQWLSNGGDKDIYNSCVVFINAQTSSVIMWSKEVFNREW